MKKWLYFLLICVSATAWSVDAPVVVKKVETKKIEKKPKKVHAVKVKEKKEVEGTRALDRHEFSSDAINKSQYQVKGAALEVDPD